MEYKGYSVESDGTFGLKKIKPVGKGSVSLDLRGSFTTATEAFKAIDRFLETKGEVTDGSKKPTSRGK